MSLAKKCDRCGTYHDGLINRLTTTGHMLLDEHEYDLCDECKGEFEDFMNGVKPKDLLSRLQALFK
jgi:hypothetical protein